MPSFTPPPHKLSAARWRGLRVGLLGGSFNPPHAGHMHIAQQAMIRFGLHAVWWVVSPGNPLKVKNPTGDLDRRLTLVRDFIGRRPGMVATDIEAHLKTRYTFDTLKELRRLFPATHFIWIAGMDNACAFERWERWADLPQIVPFAFFDRPPALAKLKGKKLRKNNDIPQYTHSTGLRDRGVYWMVRGKAINLSSTKIRSDLLTKASRSRGAGHGA